MTTAVTGATGRVGRLVVRDLLARQRPEPRTVEDFPRENREIFR